MPTACSVPGRPAYRLEEPALVALGRREVHREPAVGALEAAVHVAVAHRLVAPLVDVDERRVEKWIVGANEHIREIVIKVLTNASGHLQYGATAV